VKPVTTTAGGASVSKDLHLFTFQTPIIYNCYIDIKTLNIIVIMVFIYILQLEQQKYYIGKTNNPQFRLDSHFNLNGCEWTKKYKPISFELKPNCDDYDEDKYTIKYMEKFGIMNVRGGSFCELKLSEENKNTLKQMINGSSDKCYICGKDDHFVKDCKKVSVKKEKIETMNGHYEKCDYPTAYISTHRGGKCIIDDEEDYNDIYKLLIQNQKTDTTDSKVVCYKCGRDGHYSNECYAKRKCSGEPIYEDEDEDAYCCRYCHKEFDTLKGATCHENLYCKKKQNKKASTTDNEVVCYTCGRDGHYSNKCYASKHINGYFI